MPDTRPRAYCASALGRGIPTATRPATHFGYAARRPIKMINYVIFLRLAPAFAANLTRPGVMDAVTEAARSGRPPDAATLAALGLPEAFVTLFVRRMDYLLELRQSGLLRAAGPFADMSEGLYVCN